MLVMPMHSIQELGLTELVGINEKVDQNDYSGSVGVSVASGSSQPVSGEILSLALYATEDGTGAVQDSAGELYILDADPAVASGDTALTAVEWVTILARVKVASTDWTVDAAGGVAYFYDLHIPFHNVKTLYFVWKQTDATGLNADAAHDEQLEMNAWYVRHS